MARTNRRFEYVLGDHAREAARLRAQARLWDPVSHALFDRIGIRRGWRVLEVGPGQGSLHMELRRRVGGTVDAVERSAAFAAQLERRVRRDRLGPSRISSPISSTRICPRIPMTSSSRAGCSSSFPTLPRTSNCSHAR
ncbi:MAG: hypothetical protein QM736_24105 [Vicinamibacterales bacterium]